MVKNNLSLVNALVCYCVIALVAGAFVSLVTIHLSLVLNSNYQQFNSNYFECV